VSFFPSQYDAEKLVDFLKEKWADRTNPNLLKLAITLLLLETIGCTTPVKLSDCSGKNRLDCFPECIGKDLTDEEYLICYKAGLKKMREEREKSAVYKPLSYYSAYEAYFSLAEEDYESYARFLINDPYLSDMRQILYHIFSESVRDLLFYHRYSHIPAPNREDFIVEIVANIDELKAVCQYELGRYEVLGSPIGVSKKAVYTSKRFPYSLDEFYSFVEWWKRDLILRSDDGDLLFVSDSEAWTGKDSNALLFYRKLPSQKRGLLIFKKSWFYQARYIVKIIAIENQVLVRLGSEVWRRPNNDSDWYHQPDNINGAEMAIWFWSEIEKAIIRKSQEDLPLEVNVIDPNER